MILSTTDTNWNSNHQNLFPDENARVEAGFTLESAAKQLGLSPRYLRQIERAGNASMKTARRLARLYNCDANLFIFAPGYFVPGYFSGQRAARKTSSANPVAGADTQARASRRYSSPKPPIFTIVPSKRAGVGE